MPPPRLSPDPSDLGTNVGLQSCQSNEQGMLTPIATLAAGIKALKADPSRIVTAAITERPTGGAVFIVSADPSAVNPADVTFSYSCVACPSGVAAIGCP